jgi:molecular chaperone GrpE
MPQRDNVASWSDFFRRGTLARPNPNTKNYDAKTSMASESTEPQNAAQAGQEIDDEARAAAEELEGTLVDVDEAGLLREQLSAAQSEAAGNRDRWLRAVAELENYKKRVKRDIDDAVQRAVQGLLSDFLPVADNLDRALAALSGANEQVAAGVKMVQGVFASALERHGIEAVPGLGSPFDPAIHEALQQVASQDYPPGTVVAVFEAGYTRNGKLVRPAKVVIANEDSSAPN